MCECQTFCSCGNRRIKPNRFDVVPGISPTLQLYTRIWKDGEDAGDWRLEFQDIALLVNNTPLAYVPTATGNTTDLNRVIIDSAGDKWIIDILGNATMVGSGGGGGSGSVTQVIAGNGMNFPTITTVGTVHMGTPSNVTLVSTNNATGTTHSHAFVPGGTSGQYIAGDGTLVNISVFTQYWQRIGTTLSPLTANDNLTITGQTNLSASFASYTGDGVWDITNARPVIITTAGGAKVHIGYGSNGSGHYWPMVGFKNTSNRQVNSGIDPDGNYGIWLYNDALSVANTGIYIDRVNNRTGIGAGFYSGGSLPTRQLDIVGNLRIRTVANDNALVNLLVIDGNGNVEYRTVASLPFTNNNGTVTNFSAGVLSPLFTTSVTNPTTTPALNFILTTTVNQYQVFGRTAAGTGVPSWITLNNVAFTGAVTSVEAGAGMNFATITTTGTVIMGTPSSVTLTSINQAIGTTHSHAFTPGGTIGQYIRGDGTLATFPTLTNGTVTSVAATIGGALSVSGSPITTAGTLAFAWTGTIAQYVRGDGSLATFPTLTNGTVTSISAGAGMDFATITTTGSVIMGTPSNVTLISTNHATGTTHSHAFVPGGTAAQYIAGDGTLITFPTTSGTVTSVGLALPINTFSISGSPVTTSGTLTGTFISQAASTAFMAPYGSAGTPGWRKVAPWDLNTSGAGLGMLLRFDGTEYQPWTPTFTGTVTNFSATGLSPLFTTSVSNPTTTPALSFALISQSQKLVFASPNIGSGLAAFRMLQINDLWQSGATTGQGIVWNGTIWTPGNFVTSVAAGAGMNFTTITGAGSVVMGTPSSVTLTSINQAIGTTHTHDFAPGGTTAQYIRGDGSLATFPTSSGNNVWMVQNTTTPATNITDAIYHNGNTYLGNMSGGTSSYRLGVTGTSYFTSTMDFNNGVWIRWFNNTAGAFLNGIRYNILDQLVLGQASYDILLPGYLDTRLDGFTLRNFLHTDGNGKLLSNSAEHVYNSNVWSAREASNQAVAATLASWTTLTPTSWGGSYLSTDVSVTSNIITIINTICGWSVRVDLEITPQTPGTVKPIINLRLFANGVAVTGSVRGQSVTGDRWNFHADFPPGMVTLPAGTLRVQVQSDTAINVYNHSLILTLDAYNGS